MYRVFHRLAVVALLAVAGCGPAAPTLAEVEGTVKVKGQPMAGLRVYFNPDNVSGAKGLSSWGTTDDKGHYVLTYPDPAGDKPGAVAGAHVVVVSDPTPEEKRNVPSRINNKYSRVAQTPLKKDVVAGGKQTIDLDID